MRVNLPGLIVEKLPSGNHRIRVRVEGDPNRRIRIYVELDHKDFSEHYHAARAGIEIKPEAKPSDRAIRGSVNWLTHKYLEHLEVQVEAGACSPKTFKQKKYALEFLREDCGEYSMRMPTSEIIKIRDKKASTPAAADALVKSIKSMYKWAVEYGILDFNPAIGISYIDKGKGGAIPWTVEDLKIFREKHPFGTKAHLALTIFMFTACRISDVVLLGRDNEFERAGVKGIGWQPAKANSPYVEIPMLPPLIKATRKAEILGKTYLLTDYGKPFATPDSFGSNFQDWCIEAGLPHLSSHGIRKAAGNLLAEEGCSQYQIMSIHGHSRSKTSEIYTKDDERWKLATDAMPPYEDMNW